MSERPLAPRIDVPQLLVELEPHIRDSAIAEWCEVGPSAVSAWRSGDKRPSLVPGLLLLLLHMKFSPASSPLRRMLTLASQRGTVAARGQTRRPARVTDAHDFGRRTPHLIDEKDY